MVLCGSHDQAVPLRVWAVGEGALQSPGFKWFVQNRRATIQSRTYEAAEMATQFSVGTDWLISWSLNFGVFLSSVCLYGEHKSVRGSV